MKWIGVLFIGVALSLGGFVSSSSYATGIACDTATDTQLDEAIATEPSRLLAKLDGNKLATFLTKLTEGQYLVGTLSQVDVLYIITTKDGGNVLLMFFVDHCLIRTIPASKSIIEKML